MIFVGDISLPYSGAIDIEDIPDSFKHRNWFGNLEGCVLSSVGNARQQRIVYNSTEAIDELLTKFNFIGFALANNHILDAGSYMDTISYLREKGIPHCGLGENIEAASKPLQLTEGNSSILILNFGWEIIQCEVTNGTEIGVCPLTKGHVLKVFDQTRKKYPNYKIVPFMHWNYELEAYPQPRERELARALIDLGAYGIIGGHPHRIGGFEWYKGRPIAYSLGNWMFLQNYYDKSRIRFPDFCNEELALEWDFDTNEITLHFFSFNRKTAKVNYVASESALKSKRMNRYTPFRDMSNKEYRIWYKNSRYLKNKLLPIYYWEDSNLIVGAKNIANKIRDKAIDFILKTNIIKR